MAASILRSFIPLVRPGPVPVEELMIQTDLWDFMIFEG